MLSLRNAYLDHLLQGRRQEAGDLIDGALDDGVDVKTIYTDVFQWSQHEVGRLWELNRISVAQEHFCTAATQLIMSLCYPRIIPGENNDLKFIGTCIGGELHELGIRMVCDFLEMDGWDTDYLGANTPIPDLIALCKDRIPNVLGVSATMTFHVKHVRELVEAVRKEEDLNDMKIMVGGNPFNTTKALWKEVGADAYASDAHEAAQCAIELAETEKANCQTV